LKHEKTLWEAEKLDIKTDIQGQVDEMVKRAQAQTLRDAENKRRELDLQLHDENMQHLANAEKAQRAAEMAKTERDQALLDATSAVDKHQKLEEECSGIKAGHTQDMSKIVGELEAMSTAVAECQKTFTETENSIGTRKAAPLVEGPNVENPTTNTPESAQDQDQGHQGTDVKEPEGNHQEPPGRDCNEQMLLEELQHAHWDPGSSPGQWDYENQDWGTPRSHAAREATPETTRDEWGMIWEFEEDQGPPQDPQGHRDADETPHPPHAPPLVQGERSGTPPEGTRSWDSHQAETGVAMNSPDREMLQAIEEAESTDPIDGLCRSMMRLDLGESELQNLADVPQRAVDAYQAGGMQKLNQHEHGHRQAAQRSGKNPV
ncbi:hypothetical protein CYMTET_23209, partial [Cymbomonas tetramitiformis]